MASFIGNRELNVQTTDLVVAGGGGRGATILWVKGFLSER